MKKMTEHGAFELRVICAFRYHTVGKGKENIIRECFPHRKVDNLHGLVPPRIGKQQDFGVLGVFVAADLFDVEIRIGLDVD